MANNGGDGLPKFLEAPGAYNITKNWYLKNNLKYKHSGATMYGTTGTMVWYAIASFLSVTGYQAHTGTRTKWYHGTRVPVAASKIGTGTVIAFS